MPRKAKRKHTFYVTDVTAEPRSDSEVERDYAARIEARRNDIERQRAIALNERRIDAWVRTPGWRGKVRLILRNPKKLGTSYLYDNGVYCPPRVAWAAGFVDKPHLN